MVYTFEPECAFVTYHTLLTTVKYANEKRGRVSLQSITDNRFSQVKVAMCSV